MKLSFMTFVCPEWKLERIPRFARRAGYDGVEIRVDAGHRHGLSSGSSYARREQARRMFDRVGVDIPAVATSVKLAQSDDGKLRENIQQAREDIRLAAHLGAGVVRIFAGGDSGPLDADLAGTTGDAFTEIGDFALQYGVCPLLETGHDIIKSSSEAVMVIENIRTPNFGVLWNHSSMERKDFEALKGYLRHFHVHKEVLEEDNTNIRQLAGMLMEIDYTGYISLEIIRGENMDERELIETARRLNAQIAEA